VQDFLIEGAPDWVKDDRWDINAKANGNFPATTLDGTDPRREMVRALLVDRFKLSAHKETLHPSTTDCAALETRLVSVKVQERRR
jgi:uncharacterized protein (TIGR03435 family)